MEIDLSTPEGLRKWIAIRAGKVPDGSGATESELEATLYQQMRIAAVPLPEKQVRFHPTRQWRADFCWRELRVIVEVQGGTWTNGAHTRGGGYENDCEKMAEAQLLGYRVLYVTGDMVKDGRALRLIERMLDFARSNDT